MKKFPTPLPSAEKVVEIICEYQQGRAALHCEMRDRVTQDRNQAYTSLIEGIEGMRWPVSERDEGLALQEKIGHNEALKDVIEKVVKPLYGKE